MIPVTIGACRGWFHPPRGTPLDRGVVLCAPFGQEALATHRGWRALAEALAAAGLAALRFDYPGAGDSAGDDGQPCLDAWTDATLAAAAWLQREAGLAQVMLCGLRLGALLAATAAGRQPGLVHGLMLLAPPASGRVHARELAMAAGSAADGAAIGFDGIEVAGFRLHEADCARLATVDLGEAAAAAQAQRLLLATPFRAAGRADQAAARLGARHLEFDHMPFQGCDGFLRPAHESVTPLADFRAMARWAACGAPPCARAVQPAAAARLALPGTGEETALRFGPGGALAGILCEPGWRRPDAPALLILNAGANPHAGNGRFAVRLARHAAALGIASLRMDAHGIGDSDGEDAAAAPLEAALFGDAAIADVAAALDALEARGHARCIAVGICSGAHNAFQAALRDARIAGLALANLPAFDRAAGGAPALDGGPPPGEHPLLRRPRMLLRRLVAEFDRLAADRLGRAGGPDRARSWLRRLQRRGVTLLLAYSRDDRSLRELRAHFGRHGRTLPRAAPMRCVILSGTEHSLTPRAMQDEFIGHLDAQLRQHHGLDAPPRDRAEARRPQPVAREIEDTAA
ncbi:alpha/beta fold hydrolase [Paracraurococcus ruber]|uniref:Serine aminopeptidase S33 domain-containing protein n=1 Tax=Paracraurococcus ruber TaxID=77675 RepID=A0ABS1CR54_9PROT|nr:alpha/beta fold hydrolase [Paracraurococcus ruber]MBK1656922.1 hypothetical protein [Paracraurococcus ruber]TDG33287.1 hypothetical protein E2C05_04145 [Paracraurococcus ruber]